MSVARHAPGCAALLGRSCDCAGPWLVCGVCGGLPAVLVQRVGPAGVESLCGDCVLPLILPPEASEPLVEFGAPAVETAPRAERAGSATNWETSCL